MLPTLRRPIFSLVLFSALSAASAVQAARLDPLARAGAERRLAREGPARTTSTRR